MSSIPVYKSGIHSGEERIVTGNDRSGMVFLSGCHLSCNFCYTPETSVHKLGDQLTQGQFQGRLEGLIAQGAKNINLISPTHIWSALETPLRNLRRYHPKVPIILKVSGYETPTMIGRMAKLADVFIPDFKVFNTQIAKSVGLPPNYGPVARRAIKTMAQTHLSSDRGELKRGILVRHLLMPKTFSDSERIVDELESIDFSGYLNLMTHFLHPTGGFVTANATEVDALYERASDAEMRVIINGRTAKVSHVA